MSELDGLEPLYQKVTSRNEIVTAMRERGLTIIEAIKASMTLFGIGLGDAKSLVSSHPSWKKTAEASAPLQDACTRALLEISDAGMPSK